MRKLFAGFGALATFLGAFAAAAEFLPKVAVGASGPFDESNAYSETFTATNNGLITLSDVRIAIGFCAIETEKRDFWITPNNCDRDIPYMLVGDPSWSAPTLAPGEPFAVTLADEMNVSTEKYRAQHPKVIASWKTLSKLKGANVVVVVTYHPWPLPANAYTVKTRAFRFVAEEQQNGKVMWKPVPLSWRPGTIGSQNAP